MSGAIRWVSSEIGELTAVGVTVAALVWGVPLIIKMSEWLVYPGPPPPRHVRAKDKLPKVYRRSRIGLGTVRALTAAPVKVVEPKN